MNITLLTITIGVPLYQLVFVRCCKKYKYVPNMLKQMGLGLLCCLIKEVTEIIIHATMTEGKVCKLADNNPIVSCYFISSKININGTCSILSKYQSYCELNNTSFLLMPYWLSTTCLLLCQKLSLLMSQHGKYSMR